MIFETGNCSEWDQLCIQSKWQTTACHTVCNLECLLGINEQSSSNIKRISVALYRWLKNSWPKSLVLSLVHLYGA